MKTLYKQLYQDCCDYKTFLSDAHFVGMKGKYYDETTQKLLIIGRAPNGWEQLPTEDGEIFSREAEKRFKSNSRFDWVESKNGVLYSKHCEGYCIDNKPFWSYPKEIFNQLTSNICKDEFWVEYIAWSNLYKVSPREEGNPNKKYRQKQLAACKKILKKELLELEPTHVLIMTGFDEWFSDFSDVFDSVCDKGVRNISQGDNRNDVYVEGTATLGKSKMVIACRPEYRNMEKYVAAVMDTFSSMD